MLASAWSHRAIWARQSGWFWCSGVFDRDVGSIGSDVAGRGFESLEVYQTLDNLGVTYHFPKVEHAPERRRIDRMEQEDEDVVVDQTTVRERWNSRVSDAIRSG